uniref:NADH dehydrogenase subunit 2 n=1 Tax=Mytilisepta virgata TaxID=2547956 RepID=UPI0022A682BF|nr:NADH dehydrogenase subunit 2 [Mytilisepta virgata]UZT27171.1 NADH dehydrogenase subunit 2 [Mytilisepta virgata]
MKYMLMCFKNCKFNPMSVLSIVVMVFSSLVSVSSSTWLGVWVGFELNLLSFMVLMNLESKWAISPCTKYFIIQSLGSGLILMTFLCDEILYSDEWNELVLCAGVMLKGGIAPFHFWVPSIVNSTTWLAGGLILSWQKLAPLFLMGWLFSDWMIIVGASLSALVGGVGGLNQHSIRGLMVYSSFVHTSWMMLALISSFSLFVFYWLVYSVSLVLMFWSCFKVSKQFLKSKMRVFHSCLSLLMLSGLPPFLGFVSKLLVMMSINSVVVFVSVIGSVISLKYYLSALYSFIFGHVYWDTDCSQDISFIVIVSVFLNVLGFLLVVIGCYQKSLLWFGAYDSAAVSYLLLK